MSLDVCLTVMFLYKNTELNYSVTGLSAKYLTDKKNEINESLFLIKSLISGN